MSCQKVSYFGSIRYSGNYPRYSENVWLLFAGKKNIAYFGGRRPRSHHAGIWIRNKSTTDKPPACTVLVNS